MYIKTNFNKPHFYSNFKLLQLASMILFRRHKSFQVEQETIYKKDKSNGILNSIKFRRRLALTKIVKFNNLYYSTPTVPGFPSKAFDNSMKNGGLNFNSAGTPLKRQIDSLFLAITNKCVLNCKHCYEKQNINKESNIGLENWKAIIKLFQSKGVSIIILTGGEPLYDFERTLELLNYGNKKLSDFHLHTSGMTITQEKVRALKAAGLAAAAVGLDHYIPAKQDEIRGKGSFNSAIEALKLFNKEGIMTYVNLCATKDFIRSDSLWKYYELTQSLNVSIIQLLEPRPCGGFFGNGSDTLLTAEDKKILLEFTFKGNSSRKYRNFPIIYYVAHIEDKDQLGCHMGGLSLLYIDSVGNVCPCVFFPVSFGNIQYENPEIIFNRMRETIPHPIKSECPSLKFSDKLNELGKDMNSMPLSYLQLDKSIKDILSSKIK